MVSMDIHGYIMSLQWLSMDHPWISRILLITKWYAAWLEQISTRPTSMILSCASLWISRFTYVPFVFIMFHLFWKEPRTTKDRSGWRWASKDHFDDVLCLSDFQQIPKPTKPNMCTYTYICIYVCIYIYIYIRSRISRERFLRNSAQSLTTHFPTTGL